MKNNSTGFLLVAFFIAALPHTSFAVDSTAVKYPVAVLVRLKTQQSMVAAMIKDKKYAQLKEAQKDIAGEQNTMIHDFNDNFTYCPVYYFSDTNTDFIVKKQFDGLLMNGDSTVVKNPVINSASTDYVIVYFGYPAEQAVHQKKVKDSSKYTSNSGEPMGRGLIINNDKMEQINYLYELGYEGLFRRKIANQYSYTSKHFNIEYSPCAADFNTKLMKRDGKKGVRVSRRMKRMTKDD